jgi:stage II sporulation protein M
MSNSPLTNAIVITFLLFFTTLTVGWVGTSQNPAVGESLLKLFEKEVAGQMMPENQPDMFIKLFANNFEACILLFLGGASFGIITIFIMSLNGIVIGAIMEIVSKDHTPIYVAAAILPHGVFEVPAFILSGAHSASCLPSRSLQNGMAVRTLQLKQKRSHASLACMSFRLLSPRHLSRLLLRLLSYI